MAMNTTDIFFRRKALFMLACILLVVAAAHRPWIVLSAFSDKGFTKIVILVVAGLAAVIAIHELAQSVLRGRGEPWYARRGALIFLPAAVLCINAIFSIADNLAFKIFGIGPFLSSNSVMCMLIAVELLGIALLE